MNRKNIHAFAGVALFVLLKVVYTQLSVDKLLFLLYPTNVLVSFFTSSTASYVQSSGFFHPDLNILVEKSCAGFNFLILCFLINYLTCLQNLVKTTKRWVALPICLLSSYILTIAVNASRIIIAISLGGTKTFLSNTPNFHQLQGTFIYLFFLLLSYLILKQLLNKYFKNEEFA